MTRYHKRGIPLLCSLGQLLLLGRLRLKSGLELNWHLPGGSGRAAASMPIQSVHVTTVVPLDTQGNPWAEDQRPSDLSYTVKALCHEGDTRDEVMGVQILLPQPSI